MRTLPERKLEQINNCDQTIEPVDFWLDVCGSRWNYRRRTQSLRLKSDGIKYPLNNAFSPTLTTGRHDSCRDQRRGVHASFAASASTPLLRMRSRAQLSAGRSGSPIIRHVLPDLKAGYEANGVPLPQDLKLISEDQVATPSLRFRFETPFDTADSKTKQIAPFARVKPGPALSKL